MPSLRCNSVDKGLVQLFVSSAQWIENVYVCVLWGVRAWKWLTPLNHNMAIANKDLNVYIIHEFIFNKMSHVGKSMMQ